MGKCAGFQRDCVIFRNNSDNVTLGASYKIDYLNFLSSHRNVRLVQRWRMLGVCAEVDMFEISNESFKN